MKTKLLFLPIILLLVACCKDEPKPDPNGLPPETHEGKNTFGCLIDGAPFVAKTSVSIGGTVPVSGSFDETTSLLIIEGAREDAQEHIDIVRFLVYVISGIGQYEIHVVNAYDGYIDYSGETCTYEHNPNDKGMVKINFLDIENNIIAGTFNMTLINPDCVKTSMVITEGRFDFGY